MALREGEVMQGIEHIRLPHTIQADEAVHLGREDAGSRGNALEVEDMQSVEDHE